MKKTTPQANFDARWKEIILYLHQYFILKFFPGLYERIDFCKGVRSLDKELQKIFADWVKKGYRNADLLLEYHLLGGGIQLVLIHAEIQHIFDILLPKRMFVSFYRIFDKNPDTPVTAIALYTGENVPAVYNKYVYEFAGVKNEYTFNTFLVREQQEADLLKSENPIDLAILAGLYALQTKDDVQQALIFKKKLARLCFEKGYEKEMIRHLITFVSYLIALPEPEDMEYQKTIFDMIQPKTIPMIEDRPDVARIVEFFLLGKSLEDWNKERDKERDKEKILHAHFVLKLRPDTISKIFFMDVKHIKSLIQEAKKQGWQPTPPPTNNAPSVN